jgi:hypothetical protein
MLLAARAMSASSSPAAPDAPRPPAATARFPWRIFWLLLLASLAAQALIYGVITSKPVIRSDGVGYYLYLPAALIDGDLTLETVVRREFPDGVPGGCVNEFDGRKVIKYPLGEALLQLPFFLVAHGMAAAAGIDSSFGWPYQAGAAAAGAFYFALGGCLTWRLLRQLFSARVAGWALLLTVFGTNLFHYATYDAGFSHVYSCCLAAGLLLVSVQLPMTTRPGPWLVAGGCAGLIAVTRPTNAILLLFPLGFWLASAGSTGAAASRLWIQRGRLLAAAAAAALPVVLQLAYWKSATGHWLFYSYGAEGFDFLRPAVGKVFFSVEKGWFVYLPLAFVAVGGWFAAKAKLATYFPAIACFVVLNVWIISSWHDWGYGGSFATRPLVDSSPLFALGLAGALWRLEEQPARRRLLLGVAAACVIYTTLLMMGYWLRTLPYSQATLTDILNSLLLAGLRS